MSNKISAVWMEKGSCVGQDPELWFPTPHDDRAIRAVKQICYQCPVERECLTFALKNQIISGVWGGKTPDERDIILYGRRRPHRTWV